MLAGQTEELFQLVCELAKLMKHVQSTDLQLSIKWLKRVQAPFRRFQKHIYMFQPHQYASHTEPFHEGHIHTKPLDLAPPRARMDTDGRKLFVAKMPEE